MKRWLIFVMLCITSVCTAEDILPSSPDGILHFADRLYQYSEYRRAATEYLRYYSLYSDRVNADDALFKAALSLELSGEYANARKFLSMLEKRAEQPTQISVIRYRTANTFYQQGGLDTTLSFIASFDREMSLEYLRGFTLLRKRDYIGAGKVFSDLSAVGGELSPSFLYMVSKSRQGASLREKNPIVAGALSAVIPGLGRGYTGNWGDGFFDFLTVGATVGPAVYFYEEDRTFSIVTGLLGAFFYLGNVYGSANGAINYNDALHRDFIDSALEGVPHPPADINRTLP